MGAAAAVRAGAVVLGTTALAAVPVVTAADAWSAVRATGPAQLADLLALVGSGAAALGGLWLVVAVTAAAVDALRWAGRPAQPLRPLRPGRPGRPDRPGRSARPTLADRVAPAALRHLVAVVVTASLLTPVAAHADVAGPRSVAGTVTATAVAPAATTADPLSPGWLPAPAPTAPRTVAVASVPSPTLRAAATADGEVVVRRGDTLWDIAARHLGPGASDAAILAAWPQWHAANRDVIGDDPNTILPGQRLRPPVG